MLQEDDLIHLVFTPDLTEAGIAYASQAVAGKYPLLAELPEHHPKTALDQIQQLVLDKAVELAFRRLLVEQQVAFETAAGSASGRFPHFNLLLNGWRCIFQSCWIDQPVTVGQVYSQPGSLLQSAALLPACQVIAWLPGEKDLYLFAFVMGRALKRVGESEQSPAEDKPVYLTINPPRAWSNPEPHSRLGRLELISEGGSTLDLTLRGSTSTQNTQSERLSLVPGERVLSQLSYHALLELHTRQLPTARIRITTPTQPHSLIITPLVWRNLWLEGCDIYLGGYISHPEYSRRSRRVEPGSRVFPGILIREKARILKVAELHPVRELLEQMRTA
jgi:hypothetical protein